MSREALVSLLLFPLGLGLALGVRAWAAPVVFVALGFVYCQARMVQAGKGIPAWREPLTVPLHGDHRPAEGAGLFWLGSVGQPVGGAMLGVLFGALLLVRWLAVARLARAASPASPRPPALAAIDRAGPPPAMAGQRRAAGADGDRLHRRGRRPGRRCCWPPPALLAAATGVQFKFTLITRASYNQGFALARLPVRGVAR